MNPVIGPCGDARPRDPFRGVSLLEIPRRYASARERALADTRTPRWPDLSEDRIYEPPSAASVVWRGVLWLSRVATGLLILPTLFGLALTVGGFIGCAMAQDFRVALSFVTLALMAWYLLVGLLQWTVQDTAG